MKIFRSELMLVRWKLENLVDRITVWVIFSILFVLYGSN